MGEFTGRYAKLRLGNGGSWCREDGRLAGEYNVEAIKAGNRIDYVRLHGKKKQAIAKLIPAHIRNQLSDSRCAVLAISKVEIDHKDGRRDDPRLADAKRVRLDDFQPLSKATNNAKRQHCKECRDTGKRFDATQLGYSGGASAGERHISRLLHRATGTTPCPSTESLAASSRGNRETGLALQSPGESLTYCQKRIGC